MATAGSIVIDLLMRTGAFETDSKRAEKRLKELQKTATDAGKVLGTAIVAGATAAVTALKLTIDSMDEMSKAAQKVGTSTEEFSKLTYAANLADVSMETLASSLGKLTKSQAAALNVTSQQAKVFDALGISVTNADGSLRESTDVLVEFADEFQKLKGSPEAMAAGFALFGRSFQELIPLLKEGGSGIRAAGEELTAFGGVLSTEAGNNAEEFNDNLTRLETAAKSLALAVASDLLPDLVALSTNFVGTAKDGDTLVNTASEIADVFRAVGAAIQFGANVFGVLKSQVEATVGVLVGLNTTLNGVLNLNFDRFRAGMATVFSAVGIEQNFGNSAPAGPAARTTAGSGRRGGAPMNMAPAFDNSAILRTALGGGSAAPKKSRAGGGGKSEAEQEAERLDKAYESLKANLQETYALFNDNTEAAKVLYDTQNGELAKLSQLRKDELVTLAERNDLQKVSDELADAAADRLKDEVDLMDRQSKAVKDQIADMEFENELIGLTNIAREKAIALRYANVDAMSEEGQKITGLIDEYHKLNDSYGFVNDSIDSFGDAMASFADRTKSAKEAFGDWADDLYSTAVQWLADQAMNALKDWLSGKQDGKGGYGTGKEGGGFDWGGFVSSIFGAFGGAKAGGGDVIPGRSYLVGEEGAERFVPRTAGTIIPAMATAGMGRGGTVFNQSNTWVVREGNPQRTQEQTAQKMGQKVEEITRRNG